MCPVVPTSSNTHVYYGKRLVRTGFQSCSEFSNCSKEIPHWLLRFPCVLWATRNILTQNFFFLILKKYKFFFPEIYQCTCVIYVKPLCTSRMNEWTLQYTVQIIVNLKKEAKIGGGSTSVPHKNRKSKEVFLISAKPSSLW